MPSASGLITKINNLLNKVNATDRTVYKRIYSRSGGDALLGINNAVTTIETALSPTPVIQPIMGSNKAVLTQFGLLQIGDMIMTTSASALSQRDLSDKDLSIVLKAGDVVEEYVIVSYVPNVFMGEVIAYNVLLRSRKK